MGANKYPYTNWLLWYGDTISKFEACGNASYTLGSKLIFTDTLDANQKFCTDASA